MYKQVTIKTNLYKPLYMNESFKLTFNKDEQILPHQDWLEKAINKDNLIRFIKGESNRNDLFKTDKDINTLEILSIDIKDADLTIFTVYEKKYAKEFYRKPYSKEKEIEKLTQKKSTYEDRLKEIENDIEELENEQLDLEQEIKELNIKINKMAGIEEWKK